MSDVVKQVAADAAAAVKAAGEATAAAQREVSGEVNTGVGQARGWLRRNVWGLLGAAVALGLVAAWLLLR